jgi:hypothetical protein
MITKPEATDRRVPVLVVGGGGAGLVASMLLSTYGIDHLLISALPTTSVLPKAHVLQQRAMEVLTDVGCAEEILAAGTPARNMSHTAWYLDVAGDATAGRLIHKMGCVDSSTVTSRNAFTVGQDLGTTPGAVVLRTPVFELIQVLDAMAAVRAITGVDGAHVMAACSGGMSESERQHVQARVRAAMDAQVVNDGRHQGGRAPYGYLVVEAAHTPTRGRSPKGTGCDCSRSTNPRPRSSGGSSPIPGRQR